MVESQSVATRRRESTVAVRVRKVTKSYPGVQALRGVDFELTTGEVHGLVGANGAGKSTLIRMLSGASVPDSGSIEVQGTTMRFEDPRALRRNGIAAIYQELTIVPEMTALSNAFLGAVPGRWLFTDKRSMTRRFEELSEWMGFTVAPQARASTLSVANLQMLEIMRAVQADRDVLIMDEPTAPLGPFERSRLYDLIARLKQSRVSIIFISHDLDEVLRLCDRVSVMRDGQLIDTRASTLWSKDALVQCMLGAVRTLPARKSRTGPSRELLRVDKLGLPGKVSDISFNLGSGEVLGIAGLVGSGRTEVLRCLAGLEENAAGGLAIDGTECPWPRHVREAIGRGIVLAPEDRKQQGLVLTRSALSNLLLTDLVATANGPLLSSRKRLESATALAQQIGFDTARLNAMALNLSGGNQQKLVLGKWLHRRPRVLLLDEPTRGIDLKAKREIFQAIRNLSDQGMSVILVSSDLEEVVEYSDRILVMARGKQIGVIEGHQTSVASILNMIFEVEGRPLLTGAKP
ncbi:MAG: sugar ABC transporter ATP-binding protein [Bacteriovorax sp.]|nr:sugar ABC transporter ATP-binding protein [Rhizobacter sp.]